MAAPVIQVSPAGLSRRPAPAELERLRRRFSEDDFVHLPAFLSPDLLALVLRKVKDVRFERPEKISKIIKAQNSLTRDLDMTLVFLFHQPELFGFVRAVTGCKRIRSFAGRLLRFSPGRGDFLDWHHDDIWDKHRLVALTINLSPKPFSGGALQFKRPGAEGVTSQFRNVVCGDAVLFRGSGRTLHRNTPVTGTRPKTTFAGWFYSDKKGGEFSMFTREGED